MIDEPALVGQARRRATELGFDLSSEPGVGALLAMLAAATPWKARICELGTGAGVGLAWIVYGLGGRDDVSVYTVDTNQEMLATVADLSEWPGYVEFVCDDGARAVTEFAPLDLVFADAQGGKLDGLDLTIAALAPGGVLVVDDMDLAHHATDGLSEAIAMVREHLLGDPTLVAAELDFASGVIVATKRPV